MKSKILTTGMLSCWISLASIAQESDGPVSAESLVNDETCAAAGVDPSKPEADMSRAERRALRRCTQDAEQQLAARTEAEDDDGGLVCRRQTILGTHQRRRVCTTRAEREAMRESTTESLGDVFGPQRVGGPEEQ